MARRLPTEKKLIFGWFIDPYKRTAGLIQVPKDLHVWHQVLQCECLDAGHLQAQEFLKGHSIDVWVDDCGQLRKPPVPTFLLEGRTYYGYGLIFESDKHGETHSVGFDSEFLLRGLGLAFENWELRLLPDDYIEQLLRIIEQEDWFIPCQKETM